jgi:hypothetical protein
LRIINSGTNSPDCCEQIVNGAFSTDGLSQTSSSKALLTKAVHCPQSTDH